MTDKDLMPDILEALQDISRQQGAFTERLTRVEKDTSQIVATLHTGNGREAVVTRLAQVETHAKESRARIIKIEEKKVAVVEPQTGVSEMKRGFWAEYGKTLVPTIAAVLMALAALLTALATRYTD